jgi:hypothetical protein
MALSLLGNTERGLRQSALRQLYQSCITTVADFGAEVWFFLFFFCVIHTAYNRNDYGI